MYKLLVAGSGTDVGKTVVAAILTTLTKGDYWKPIECGEGDTKIMKDLIDPSHHTIHKPAYSLASPLSPHHAARLENVSIRWNISPPKTDRPLVIESVGGVFVPLTQQKLSIDLFKSWNCRWIIVSRHELGSINHTLLTLYALKKHRLPIAGLIFNGSPNPDSETAILRISKIPFLTRLYPEQAMNAQTIQRYVKRWKPLLSQLLP